MSELYPARVRIWKQSIRWKKDHPGKGDMFPAVYAGEVTVVRIPVFIHPCSVCGASHAPFGINGIWYCRECWPR